MGVPQDDEITVVPLKLGDVPAAFEFVSGFRLFLSGQRASPANSSAIRRHGEWGSACSR